MPFRDDAEALLAHVEALEKDLAESRREADELRQAHDTPPPAPPAPPAAEPRVEAVAPVAAKPPPATRKPPRAPRAGAERGWDDMGVEVGFGVYLLAQMIAAWFIIELWAFIAAPLAGLLAGCGVAWLRRRRAR